MPNDLTPGVSVEAVPSGTRSNQGVGITTAAFVGRAPAGLNEAWPTEWKAHPLDALEQQLAIDSLTLVFESSSHG